MGNLRRALFSAAVGLVASLGPLARARGEVSETHPSAGVQAASPSPPTTDAPAEPRDFDAWLAAQRDARGRACERLAVEIVESQYVVACGGAGVWVVKREAARDFVLVRAVELAGPAVGLSVRHGKLFATVIRTGSEAVDVSGEAPSSRSFPVEAAPPPTGLVPVMPATARDKTPPAPRVEGHVTKLLPGVVEIDLGRRDGVRLGQSVAFSVLRREEIGNESAVERQNLAVGEVTALSPSFSRVRLGIGERVPLGALARVSDEGPTATRVAPPRLGGLWEVGFMIRPFIALGDMGGGVMLDASVGYRFEGPFHLEAALSPLAYGTGADHPSITPVAAYLKGSYDLELFEVGVGIGGTTVYDTTYPAQTGSGTLFVQELRFGAVDGLKFDLRTEVVLFRSRFEFAGMTGVGQIPVGKRAWFLMRGGGGSAGYGYGELGVRVLLAGNGDRGSVYFTGSLGGLGVFGDLNRTCVEPTFEFECTERVTYAGPLLGAGAEWRF